MSPDGDTLAAVSNDADVHQVRLWGIAEGRVMQVLRRTGKADYYGLAFSPDGRYLAIATHPGPIVLWNVFTDEVRIIQHKSDAGSYCAFSPDGRHLAVWGMESAGIHLVNVETGDEAGVLLGQRCAAFSPDGRLIAFESAKSVCAVEIWDRDAHRSVAVMAGHTSLVTSLSFSGDGRFLVSGSKDGTAKVWDVVAHRERFTVRGHETELSAVAFTPDGQSLATASTGGTVKFWDVATGQPLLTLPVANSSVESISFSSDSRILATSSYHINSGGQVDLWHAPRTD
jgi:WD40 repeat protein